MSKELEALNKLGATHKFDGGDYYSLCDKKEFKIVKEGLQRLEAIENSKPSEALVYIDAFIDENNSDIKNQDTTGYDIDTQAKWVNYLEYKSFALSTIKQALQRSEVSGEVNGDVNVEVNPNEALECLKHIQKYYVPEPCTAKTYDCLETIKQTLLRLQQPKQYLKWEDLRFTGDGQKIKVKLNGETYILDYKYTCEHDVIHLSTLEYDRVLTCCGDYGCDIRFFNDLHLERIEE